MKSGRPSIPKNRKKIVLAFSLSPRTIVILDQKRGELSRSAYVDKMIRGRK